MREHVETLIKKSAEANKSEDSQRFAQAALNAANAMVVLNNQK